MNAIERNSFDRFLNKIEFSPTGCWLWNGLVDKDGYGRHRPGCGTKYMRAHRFSYEVFIGPIPHGLNILHSCDIPGCVRPWDLFPGTNRDNINDMLMKGRTTRGKDTVDPLRRARGARCGRSKLSESTVIDIRSRHNYGESYRSIGRTFGINKKTVTKICSGESWKHIPIEPPT